MKKRKLEEIKMRKWVKSDDDECGCGDGGGKLLGRNVS